MLTPEELFLEIETLYNNSSSDYSNNKWASIILYLTDYKKIISEVKEVFTDINTEQIDDIPYDDMRNFIPGTGNPPAERAKFREIVNKTEKLYKKIKEKFNIHEINDTISIIKRLCDKFHSIVKQLNYSREGHSTFTIKDEYDVQNLFTALLKIYFDDIRLEEWTPSYAGRASRMDVLLKNEKTVIEFKKTRANLVDKNLGEQLLIDIEKYSVHQDCKTLICFVYDPDEHIINPRGIEADLMTKSNSNLKIIVIIK